MLLYPNTYYHIYNHAVSDESLFRSPENYKYFLKKYVFYISPIAKTIAYCLMPNHIHFIVQIKNEKELSKIEKIINYYSLEDYVMKQFSNLFSSYTQAYNKVFGKRGNLFISKFKRKLIDNENYLEQLVYYVHNNPVNHGFVENVDDWDYSSYRFYISNEDSFLDKDYIFRLFGGMDNFIKFHSQQQDIDEIKVMIKE